MSALLPLYACFFILLPHFSGAKPAPDPQSLKQPHSSEEVQKEVEAQVETEMEGEAEAEGTGEALLGAQLDSINSDVLMRFLSDLVRSSKRSRSRLKKGGLRSCFGVRLARIGSFSGLGC